MGIVNRSKDSSEQQFAAFQNLTATVTGESDAVAHMAQAGTIIRGKLSAVGLSGAPTAQLQIRRFVTGAGQTLIPLGAALTLVACSTSGPQSYTFSSTALQSGDVIVATHAGSNAAVDQLNVSIVIQSTQDIKSWTY